jgi:hypothetical protein
MLFTTYLTIDDELLSYVSLAAKFAFLPVNPCFELENCGFWAEFDSFQDFRKKCPVICPVRLLVTQARAKKGLPGMAGLNRGAVIFSARACSR